MILPQSEIDSIMRKRQPRRMLRLPVRHGEHGERKRCPVKLAGVYDLKPSRDAERKATITVTTTPRLEKLAALTDRDARREGHANVIEALARFEQLHGRANRNTVVWVVEFVEGDHADEYRPDTPVFLAKEGDYTTVAGRQAVPGDPEVTILPGEGERARVVEIARRILPQQEAVEQMHTELGALRESMVSMKARNRAKLIQRELAKLAQELPPGQDLLCA